MDRHPARQKGNLITHPSVGGFRRTPRQKKEIENGRHRRHREDSIYLDRAQPGIRTQPGNEFFVDFAGGLTIWEDDGSPDRTGYFIPNRLFKRIVTLIADVHDVSGGSINDWLAL
jgi:hypothetical protein